MTIRRKIDYPHKSLWQRILDSLSSDAAEPFDETCQQRGGKNKRAIENGS